jgi:hypothetical protein
MQASRAVVSTHTLVKTLQLLSPSCLFSIPILDQCLESLFGNIILTFSGHICTMHLATLFSWIILLLRMPRKANSWKLAEELPFLQINARPRHGDISGKALIRPRRRVKGNRERAENLAKKAHRREFA